MALKEQATQTLVDLQNTQLLDACAFKAMVAHGQEVLAHGQAKAWGWGAYEALGGAVELVKQLRRLARVHEARCMECVEYEEVSAGMAVSEGVGLVVGYQALDFGEVDEFVGYWQEECARREQLAAAARIILRIWRQVRRQRGDLCLTWGALRRRRRKRRAWQERLIPCDLADLPQGMKWVEWAQGEFVVARQEV